MFSTSEIPIAPLHSVRRAETSFTFQQVTDVVALGVCWRALEDQSEASFFQTWDWIEPWIIEAQIKPWILVGRQSDRIVLMALLIDSRQRRHGLIKADSLLLHQIGEKDRDVLSIGYNGFLVDSRMDGEIITRALEHLRRVTALSFIEVQLNRISEAYWRRAQMAGFRSVLLCRNPSWRVDLAAVRSAGGNYLESLSANTRYQIRRSLKLYKQRGNLTPTFAATVKEGLEFFTQLRDLNITYWSSRRQVASFSYPFFERFHRRLIEHCLPKGTVELVRIGTGETPIGFLYNFVSNGHVYAYQSGFAYQDDAKLKPGLVSHELCIERHLRTGARVYDFLAGQARYKANLGIAGPDLLDCSLQRPSISLQIENLLRTAKRQVAVTFNWASSHDDR